MAIQSKTDRLRFAPVANAVSRDDQEFIAEMGRKLVIKLEGLGLHELAHLVTLSPAEVTEIAKAHNSMPVKQ